MSEVVFAVESYSDVVEELKPMLPEHWAELAVHKDIPLDPNYERYRLGYEAGMILFTTVRKVDALIGYAIWVVNPHPHYQTHSWALNDIIWLHPDHRGQHLGFSFVKFWEKEFRARNVAVVHVDTKTMAPQLLHLLHGCGYETTSVGVEKRL